MGCGQKTHKGEAPSQAEEQVSYSYDRTAKANDFGEKQFGSFTVRYLKQHEPFADPIGKVLLEAEKMYAAAGVRIPDNIRVALDGRQAGKNRAWYWPGSSPPIFYVAPKAFSEANLLHTVIHELGHYFHDKVVPGGMGNQEVRARYAWAVRQKKTQEGGRVDVLERKARALNKRYIELQDEINLRKPLPRKGEVFEFDDWFNGTQYHVKGRMVGKRDSRTVLVELIEATEKYVRFQSVNQRGPGPLIFPTDIRSLTYAGKDEAKVKELAEVEKERAEIFAELKAGENKPDDRYEVQHHDWLPTTYARKNNDEYFAEMMTTFVLGHLKPDPSRWLLSIVKTGEPPKDLELPSLATTYSYDRSAADTEQTPTEVAIGKLSPLVLAWLKNPHAAEKPLFKAYAALSDDEKGLISQDVYETFSKAHNGSTVIAYKIKENPHHKGGAALTTKKPDHLMPEEMGTYLVRAKDVLAHWGQEELPLGEDIIILKPNARPLPFEG